MRQTILHSLFFMTVLWLACPSDSAAQPTGGPYGPLAQSYALPEAGKLIFVAPDAVGDACGTTLESPTTIEQAFKQAETGDTIILRGGTYRTGSLRFNQGITIQPYLTEYPVFKGTLPLPADVWEALPDGRWQTQWTLLFPAAPADWWRAEWHLDTTPLHRFNYDMVFADGRRLTSMGEVDSVVADTYHIDYEQGIVTIGMDPAEHAIEITAHDSALVRTTRRVHGRENDGVGPTLRGIKFTRYARLALLVEGVEPGEWMDPADYGKEVVGTTFEHLTISHCSRVAGYFRGDGFTMRHCLVADCGTEGIYVINSSNVLLERNIVTRTNSHAPIMGYYASAIKIFNQSHHVVCRDNLIIDNPHASGIWYDVGNNHGLVLSNWVETTNDGFFFEISEGAIAAGNVFVNCTPGVRILNSADVTITQNTFYNSPINVTRSLRSSEAGDHFGWHASTGPSVADRDRNRITNNLFLADTSLPEGFIQYRQQVGVEEVAKAGQIERLNGNAYLRLEGLSPLMTWGQTWPNPTQDRAAYDLDKLQSVNASFEVDGILSDSPEWPVVRSIELKRFELLAPLTGVEKKQDMEVFDMLEWSQTDQPFPGAYPPLAH